MRQLAGVTGTVTASYAYDSFGGLRQSADNDTTYKNEFQYKDEIADAGTGTIYLRARYYDPKSGRFISRDPVAGYTASPQSLNGYAYARSNPVMRSDPTGMTSDFDNIGPPTYVTPQGESTGDFNRYASEFRRSRDGVNGAGKGRVQAVPGEVVCRSEQITSNFLTLWGVSSHIQCSRDVLLQGMEQKLLYCDGYDEATNKCASQGGTNEAHTCLQGNTADWYCEFLTDLPFRQKHDRWRFMVLLSDFGGTMGPSVALMGD